MESSLLHRVDEAIGKTSARSRSEFISDVLEFYIAWLHSEETGKVLTPALESVISGRIGDTENRIARVLFKQSVELAMLMIERPLMSADELKSMPKGSFVVMKTGTHPMKTKLKLFFKWGIQFGQPLKMPDRGSRPVHYASKNDLERAILQAYPIAQTAPPVPKAEEPEPESQPASQTSLRTAPKQETEN